MVDPFLGAGRRLWLTETIRLSEERWGPYDDSEIVRSIRHATPTVDLASAIQQRNIALAQREGLDRLAAQWRDNAWLTALGGILVAVITGGVAAAAALGDGSRQVNLFWALGGLLGMHLLTLLFWLITLRWSPRAGALGRLVMATATRISQLPPLAKAGRGTAMRPSAAALLPRALRGMLQRAGMLRALLGSFSHAWWLLALLSAFVTLIALLATRRYEFIWETTLLSSQSFVAATQALGWLPGLLGFDTPDAATIRASDGLQTLGPAAHIMWSRWLLGCVLVYGILPRFLALAACVWLMLRRRPRLRLDPSLPGLAVLADRLQPVSQRLGVTDPALPDATDPTALAPRSIGEASDESIDQGDLASGFIGRLHEPDQNIIVGVELADDAEWPPLPTAPSIIDAGVLDTGRQRNALLDQFARNPPNRLLIICDGTQTPDRGTISLLAEMVGLARSFRIELLGDPTEGRHDHWRSRLAGAGVPVGSLAGDLAASGRWLLGGGHQETNHG